MFKPAPSKRVSGDKEAQLSNIALLYYGEGLTQGEIAKRMKVSRTTVVNMLRESRELGIVEIRVDCVDGYGKARKSGDSPRFSGTQQGASDATRAAGTSRHGVRCHRQPGTAVGTFRNGLWFRDPGPPPAWGGSAG